MLFKIGVLKNFGNLTGNHLCWSLLFNKDAGLNVCNAIKKRLQHRCFPVNITKFLRTAFYRTSLLVASVTNLRPVRNICSR